MAFGKEEMEVELRKRRQHRGHGHDRPTRRRPATCHPDRPAHACQAEREEQGLGRSDVAYQRQCIVAQGPRGPGAGISLPGRSGLRTSGVGSSINATAGTVSSLAFTPMQGLELVDPKVQAELSRKRKADEDRWFKGGTFTQVGGPRRPARATESSRNQLCHRPRESTLELPSL